MSFTRCLCFLSVLFTFKAGPLLAQSGAPKTSPALEKFVGAWVEHYPAGDTFTISIFRDRTVTGKSKDGSVSDTGEVVTAAGDVIMIRWFNMRNTEQYKLTEKGLHWLDYKGSIREGRDPAVKAN